MRRSRISKTSLHMTVICQAPLTRIVPHNCHAKLLVPTVVPHNCHAGVREASLRLTVMRHASVREASLRMTVMRQARAREARLRMTVMRQIPTACEKQIGSETTTNTAGAFVEHLCARARKHV